MHRDQHRCGHRSILTKRSKKINVVRYSFGRAARIQNLQTGSLKTQISHSARKILNAIWCEFEHSQRAYAASRSISAGGGRNQREAGAIAESQHELEEAPHLQRSAVAFAARRNVQLAVGQSAETERRAGRFTCHHCACQIAAVSRSRSTEIAAYQQRQRVSACAPLEFLQAARLQPERRQSRHARAGANERDSASALPAFADDSCKQLSMSTTECMNTYD